MDAIRAVQTQIEVSDDDARAALEHTKGDITEAILYLYKVPPPPVKPKTEWDERREICAEYETAMEQFVQQRSHLAPTGDGNDSAGAAAPIRVIPAPKRI